MNTRKGNSGAVVDSLRSGFRAWFSTELLASITDDDDMKALENNLLDAVDELHSVNNNYDSLLDVIINKTE